MGLIKMAVGSVKSNLADQVLEYFYCDSLPDDVLLRKGSARNANNQSATKYGSTNNGSDNIISNGSRIAVNEGQGMLIVQDGKITDFSMEPGTYVVDTSTEPSLFAGKLGQNIIGTFKNIGNRFTFGGDTGKDQRVYYVNLRPLANQMWGTATPISYAAPILGAQKQNLGSSPVNIGCHGTYRMAVTDPLLLFKSVGNVPYEYKYDKSSNWYSQVRAQIEENLALTIQSFSMEDVTIEMLQAVGNAKLKEKLNTAIQDDIVQTIGIGIEQFTIQAIKPMQDEQYDEYLKTRAEVQQTSRYMDQGFAQGGRAMGQVEMMKGVGQGAAKGGNGGTMDSAMNMMGMAMMGNMMNGNNMFGGGANGQNPQQGGFNGAAPMAPQGNPQGGAPQQGGWDCPTCGQKGIVGGFCNNCGAKKPEPQAANTWKCSCGADNTGKFCMACGAQKPDANGAQKPTEKTVSGWKCTECGADNSQGMFCHNCGAKKPAAPKKYKCDKCGWQPTDATKPPKFCPQCGDIFDENDITE